MDNLKKFKIVLEQRETKISHVEIEVEAQSKEDARILAKYRAVNSWEWKSGGPREEKVSIFDITEIPEVRDEPAGPPSSAVIEPIPTPLSSDGF